VTVWPAPDQNSKYELYLNVLSRIDDADVGANTMQIPFRFYPCLSAGLAYYLALKKAPDKVQMLKSLYEEEFDRAYEPRRGSKRRFASLLTFAVTTSRNGLRIQQKSVRHL
jgi:hypothetical protein